MRAGWGLMFARREYATELSLSVQKTFITFITVTVTASNVLAADVFSTGIFH